MVSALFRSFQYYLARASEVQKIAWHPASSHSSCWEDLWAIIAGSSIPWVIRFWGLNTQVLPLRCTPISWLTLRFWPLSHNYTKSGIQWFLCAVFLAIHLRLTSDAKNIWNLRNFRGEKRISSLRSVPVCLLRRKSYQRRAAVRCKKARKVDEMGVNKDAGNGKGGRELLKNSCHFWILFSRFRTVSPSILSVSVSQNKCDFRLFTLKTWQ